MPSSPCAHKPSALRAAVCWRRRSLPPARHPPASRVTYVEHSACHLPTRHHPPANARRNIRRLPACYLPASSPCNARQLTAMPASSSRAIRHRTAQHPLALSTSSAAPLQAIRWREAMPLAACMSEPSSRTDTLNPRKNTLCTIVNCPLQIKPVFYFLFTSNAPSAHRIRVKSSLLRLGRFCLALPFTHLGKDIT